MVHQPLGDLPQRLLPRGGVQRLDAPAALQDGAPRHAPGQGGGEDGLHAHAAGGLPRQGDGVRVAPKGGDVLLDPVQGENLVENAVVAGDAFLCLLLQGGVGEEAKGVHPVVDGHQNHALFGKALAVKLLFRAAPVQKGAPVNPKEHRQPGLGRGGGRGPDVQVQAVLAFVVGQAAVELLAVEVHGGQVGLGAAGPKGGAVPHSLPGGMFLGAAEAQRPHRGLGIGHAPEDDGLLVLAQGALHGPLLCGDDGFHERTPPKAA